VSATIGDEARRNRQAMRIDKPRPFKLADRDPAQRFGLSPNIQDVRPILAEGLVPEGLASP
jgi:hypothetical protein